MLGSRECIVTVLTGVAEAITSSPPPMSATLTFDPPEMWSGSDRERIALQLDANLKPAHITEGNQNLSHGFMGINQLLALSSPTACSGVHLHGLTLALPTLSGEIPFLALVLLHVLLFPG